MKSFGLWVLTIKLLLLIHFDNLQLLILFGLLDNLDFVQFIITIPAALFLLSILLELQLTLLFRLVHIDHQLLTIHRLFDARLDSFQTFLLGRLVAHRRQLLRVIGFAVRIEICGTVEGSIAEVARVHHSLAVRHLFVDDQRALRFVRFLALIAGEWGLIGVFGGVMAFEEHSLFGDVRTLVAFQLDVGVEQHVGFEAALVHHPVWQVGGGAVSRLMGYQCQIEFVLNSYHLPHSPHCS